MVKISPILGDSAKLRGAKRVLPLVIFTF